MAELRQQEGEIWGTTEWPSPVRIEVEVIEQDSPRECARWEPTKQEDRVRHRLKWSKPFDGRSPLPYVLFPFQGKTPDGNEPKDPSKMIGSARFKISVNITTSKRIATYGSIFNQQRKEKGLPQLADEDNIEKDVEAAIWAWVNFGGIGARTRRGCGALYCGELAPPDSQGFKKWLGEQITYYDLPKEEAFKTIISSSPPRKWPILGEIYLKDGQDSISCWKDSIKVLRELRQGSRGRDNGSSMYPGRSHWPEPESIRKIILAQKRLTRRPRNWHDEDPRMKSIAFPRIEFGMPIIIEIKKEDIKPTLQPNENHDRMASPLIFRPIGFRNGQFASMIIRLKTESVDLAYIKPGKRDLVSGRVIFSSQIKLRAATPP